MLPKRNLLVLVVLIAFAHECSSQGNLFGNSNSQVENIVQRVVSGFRKSPTCIQQLTEDVRKNCSSFFVFISCASKIPTYINQYRECLETDLPSSTPTTTPTTVPPKGGNTGTGKGGITSNDDFVKAITGQIRQAFRNAWSGDDADNLDDLVSSLCPDRQNIWNCLVSTYSNPSNQQNLTEFIASSIATDLAEDFPDFDVDPNSFSNTAKSFGEALSKRGINLNPSSLGAVENKLKLICNEQEQNSDSCLPNIPNNPQNIYRLIKAGVSRNVAESIVKALSNLPKFNIPGLSGIGNSSQGFHLPIPYWGDIIPNIDEFLKNVNFQNVSSFFGGSNDYTNPTDESEILQTLTKVISANGLRLTPDCLDDVYTEAINKCDTFLDIYSCGQNIPGYLFSYAGCLQKSTEEASTSIPIDCEDPHIADPLERIGDILNCTLGNAYPKEVQDYLNEVRKGLCGNNHTDWTCVTSILGNPTYRATFSIAVSDAVAKGVTNKLSNFTFDSTSVRDAAESFTKRLSELGIRLCPESVSEVEKELQSLCSNANSLSECLSGISGSDGKLSGLVMTALNDTVDDAVERGLFPGNVSTGPENGHSGDNNLDWLPTNLRELFERIIERFEKEGLNLTSNCVAEIYNVLQVKCEGNGLLTDVCIAVNLQSSDVEIELRKKAQDCLGKGEITTVRPNSCDGILSDDPFECIQQNLKDVFGPAFSSNLQEFFSSSGPELCPGEESNLTCITEKLNDPEVQQQFAEIISDIIADGLESNLSNFRFNSASFKDAAQSLADRLQELGIEITPTGLEEIEKELKSFCSSAKNLSSCLTDVVEKYESEDLISAVSAGIRDIVKDAVERSLSSDRSDSVDDTLQPIPESVRKPFERIIERITSNGINLTPRCMKEVSNVLQGKCEGSGGIYEVCLGRLLMSSDTYRELREKAQECLTEEVEQNGLARVLEESPNNNTWNILQAFIKIWQPIIGRAANIQSLIQAIQGNCSNKLTFGSCLQARLGDATGLNQTTGELIENFSKSNTIYGFPIYPNNLNATIDSFLSSLSKQLNASFPEYTFVPAIINTLNEICSGKNDTTSCRINAFRNPQNIIKFVNAVLYQAAANYMNNDPTGPGGIIRVFLDALNVLRGGAFLIRGQ